MNVTNYEDRCDENNIRVFLPEEGLTSLANRFIIQNNESKKDHDDSIQVIAHVKALDSKPFAHPNGRFAQTFQITYDNNYHLDDTDSLPYPPISKSDAKQLFQIFCDNIPIEYPGTTLRLIITFAITKIQLIVMIYLNPLIMSSLVGAMMGFYPN